jgi:hypothetical protein
MRVDRDGVDQVDDARIEPPPGALPRLERRELVGRRQLTCSNEQRSASCCTG